MAVPLSGIVVLLGVGRLRQQPNHSESDPVSNDDQPIL